MTKYLFWGGRFEQEHLSPARIRSYVLVILFVAGNLLFPAIVHSFPQGGPMFLPIYFFTLIASYRFGWWAGLATALLSPLANTLLTGMPPAQFVDAILVKSVALAVVAALVAKFSRQVSLGGLIVVVVGYQLLGGIYEAVKAGALQAAFVDWVLGWPGLLIQVVLGGLVLGLWGRGSSRAD